VVECLCCYRWFHGFKSRPRSALRCVAGRRTGWERLKGRRDTAIASA
jgi:hypothetical protein